ncbi:MAG: sulfatase-like hydrolase/transferase, partial [Saprospiraceae bacterium]|nr:sulfatase-like hydrolase/transferase [Saprospiraceae bacterium]
GESLRFGWRAVGEGQPSEPYGTFYWSNVSGRESDNLKGDDTKILTDRVISFINESTQRGQPFFANLWLHTPHLPLVCADTFRQLYSHLSLEEQLLYGSITSLDQQIGRLVDHLRVENIFDNTLIWFCSDNGPEIATPGSAGIFRERKRSLYEGGIRVPAFICWPSEVAAGSQTNTPVVTSDFLPTIVRLVNAKYPDPTRPLDGIDLSESILNDSWMSDRAIGFRYRNDKFSWMTNQYKLISTDSMQSFELFDLLDDPSEKMNIYSENLAVAQEMQTDLLNWLSSCEASESGKDYQ